VLFKVFPGDINEDIENREKILRAIAQNKNLHKVFLIADLETDFHFQLQELVLSKSLVVIKLSN